MPDLKKLITGFLIIATAATASALLLSNTVTPTNANSVAVVLPSTDPSLSGQSAFVPTQQDLLDAADTESPQVAQALADPNNLTTNFTDAFLNSVSVENPGGLQTDSSGNLDFKQPDAKTLSAQLAANPNFTNIPISNWDAEAAAQKIIVSATTSGEAYNEAVNGAVNKDLIQSGIANMEGQTDLDSSNFAAIAEPLQSVIGDIAQVPTPANLADFQKELITALVYQKNMAALADLAQTDPVKAVITYQAENSRYLAVMQNFNNQFQSATAKGLISFGVSPLKPNPLVAFIDSSLGVQTAYAQWPTWDFPTFARWVEDEADAIILQILKNTLTAFIQQRVLTWIQGSGAPLFVQQFGQELVQAGQKSAMAAVAQILPGYQYSCPNIGNLLKQTSLGVGVSIPTGSQLPQCTLSAVSVSQLTNFYNNFSFSGVSLVPGGSWGLYAQLLNPNNSYYGAVFEGSAYASQQINQAQQTQQTKQIANQGLKAQTACPEVNGVSPNPNGTTLLCSDGETQPTNGWSCPNGDTAMSEQLCDGVQIIPGGPACSGVPTTGYICPSTGQTATYGPSCSDGKPPTQQSNGGQCPPSTPGGDWTEPEATTPGAAVMGALGNALDASDNLLANANSPAGVLASVGASLINTLVEAGVTAAVNKGTQGLLSVSLSATAGGSSTNNGVSPTQPTPPTGGPSLPATACSPKAPMCTSGPGGQCTTLSQDIPTTFFATGGDGLDYTWAVGNATDEAGNPVSVAATPTSGSDPTFSPYFTVANAPQFPITIPVTVTGSDGKSDTCLAVLGQ